MKSQNSRYIWIIYTVLQDASETVQNDSAHWRNIWAVTWDFQQCGMCDQQGPRPACAYAQSDQSLCWSLEYSMNFKLLTEQHLELLSLKGGCTGSSESTLVKMPHCWKPHVTAQIVNGTQNIAKWFDETYLSLCINSVWSFDIVSWRL